MILTFKFNSNSKQPYSVFVHQISLKSQAVTMAIYSSDSDEQPSSSQVRRLFGRQRPLHAIFGGGRVADVVLWRKKGVSAAILLGVTVIWFLFEVLEYHFFTLLCHLSILLMLIVFIWSNGASLFDRKPPRIPEIILSESAFREVSLIFRAKLNRFLITLYDIACGKDLALFFLVVGALWIVSVIGTQLSTLNLIYLGVMAIGTVPALYERYEHDVDYLASKGNRDLKKLYRKFDSKVLNKIPRGPVKERKYK